jgi:hypothetical protein
MSPMKEGMETSSGRLTELNYRWCKSDKILIPRPQRLQELNMGTTGPDGHRGRRNRSDETDQLLTRTNLLDFHFLGCYIKRNSKNFVLENEYCYRSQCESYCGIRNCFKYLDRDQYLTNKRDQYLSEISLIINRVRHMM